MAASTSGSVFSLLELAEKAGPAPWRLRLDDPEFPWVVVDADGRGLSRREDAELIVAAVNLVPALAQEWEAMRAALERLTIACERRIELAHERPDRPDASERWTAVVVEHVKATDEARAALSAGVSPQPKDST